MTAAFAPRRRPGWQALALAALVAASVLVPLAILPAAAAPLRVMPLGDSNTRGLSDDPPEHRVAYRRALYQALQQRGISVDLVGSQRDGSNLDPDHEGYSALHAAGGSAPAGSPPGLVANVYRWLAAAAPDVALLHIGTNDINGGDEADVVASDINAALGEIDRYETEAGRRVHVVLARIVNRQDPGDAMGQRTTALNQRIGSLVESRKAAGDAISVVDMESALKYPDDMADTLHPNPTGYAKMAGVWMAEIERLLAPPPPTTTAPPATTAPAASPPAPAPSQAPAPAASRSGYLLVDRDGNVYAFGDSAHLGSANFGGVPAVDIESTPTGHGYWVVSEHGAVQAFGDAPHHGGVTTPLSPGERVTSLSATANGGGYWIFTSLGRAIAFGNAVHRGDMLGTRLNGPVLDSIATPSDGGYYMVASDGGIFAFGDARFFGSMGDVRLNAPVESLVPDSDGVGYWLVATDGGVFAFDAPFVGSLGDLRLNAPVTGMIGYGNGYLLVATDGGIFVFSDRPFSGSLGDRPPASPITAVTALG